MQKTHRLALSLALKMNEDKIIPSATKNDKGKDLLLLNIEAALNLIPYAGGFLVTLPLI